MSYEIDFLPVGDGERSGDAIALRYGDLHRGDQIVTVVDGGYTDDGEALMDHIERYYRTTFVDRVINTHPDDNHIRGLIPLVEKLSVGEGVDAPAVVLHQPGSQRSGTRRRAA